MPDAASSPAAADSPGADLSGRTLGEFEVLRKIGSGGMGQVYLARQTSLKRQVALKLLRKDLATNPTAMKRFEDEAVAVASLNHPNIVQVYGAGESDGLRYMALEFVDGRNLREHLARKGPPELPVAMSIMKQIAAALQKAHEQGLVHRDIKPENILVTKKVEVKVTDFGLSRFFNDPAAVSLTQSGVTLGTPLYLSPEQAQGKTVDHRSDLYSFGVTCYHLLAGEPPFRGTTPVEVALKHITDQPKPLESIRPDLPPELCEIVRRLMLKRPEERYASARDVTRELNRVNVAAGPHEVIAVAEVPAAPLALSTSQPVALSSGSTLALPPVAAPALGWLKWALAAFGLIATASLGAVAYVLTHPKPEPTPAPTPAPFVGLPDIRTADKIVAPRERELLAILKDRATTPDDWIAASIELGLMQVREGRLDAAAARFEAMEREQIPNFPAATSASRFAGRLGKAIVMAHRDNDPAHPQAASNSMSLFTAAMATPLLIPPTAKKEVKFERIEAMRAFLARHAELAQAAAEALNRNVANGAKIPQASPLELLRSPRGLLRKESSSP